MNAGLLGLATRRGVIHVEEIAHETKSSSVGRVGRNIFQLLQNHCLRCPFKFSPHLSFQEATLLPQSCILEQLIYILIMTKHP